MAVALKNVTPTSKVKVTNGDLRDEAGGICPKVMATLDGQKVMVKGEAFPGKSAMAERFAYTLGTELGLKVNKVQVAKAPAGYHLGEWVTIHYWMDGFTNGFRLQDGLKEFDQKTARAAIALFDFLLCNEDRHDGNWGLVGKQVAAIDHGHCKPWASEVEPLRTFYKGWNFKDNGVLRWLKTYTDNNREYTGNVKRALHRFLHLTADDFNRLAEMPEGYDPLGSRRRRIVARMLECQKQLRGLTAVDWR